MKITWKWMLMAALVCSLSFTVTSCKDDDDNGSSEEQKQAEKSEKAEAFWAVVGQLVGTTQVTDDYQGKTFEPTIGQAKDGNATVRIVATNDMASAAERFANLVGLDDGVVTAETASYTWSDANVGTLTYSKTTDGTSLATVNVSIKQVPRLQQIVYMTPQQMGTNANNATCYYRFGDVISRKRPDDDIKEFWICVRPSFDPEGKGESHWVSLSPLPKQNILEHTTSNKDLYRLPTKLGTNEEQMINLAEMLYAITNPHQWEENVKNNPAPGLFSSGLRMFHDFDHSKVDYHSELFWQRVAKGWRQTIVDVDDKEKNLFGALFDKSEDELSNDLNGEAGLHLLHKGYSWWWSSSNDLTLYDFSLRNGQNSKSNMHDYKNNKVTAKVFYKNPSEASKIILVDIAEQYTEDHPHLDDQVLKARDGENVFFDDDYYHYFIRHATGTELAKLGGGQYDKKIAITGFKDVYVYNTLYNKDLGKTPETRDDIENDPNSQSVGVGSFVGSDGNFYASKNDAQAAGTEAIAIVVALRNKKHPVENGTTYNGLAMALEQTVSNPAFLELASGHIKECGLKVGKTYVEEMELLNGITVTNQMVAGCGHNHKHSAVEECRNYEPSLSAEVRQQHHFSEWFMPSYGQWLVAMQEIGMIIPYDGGEQDRDYLDMKRSNEAKAMKFFESHSLNPENYYYKRSWTCSVIDLEEGELYAHRWVIGYRSEILRWAYFLPLYATPFMAFEYEK